MGRYGLHWISTLVSCIESGLYSLYLKKFVYRTRHHLPVFIRTKLGNIQALICKTIFCAKSRNASGFSYHKTKLGDETGSPEGNRTDKNKSKKFERIFVSRTFESRNSTCFLEPLDA